MTFRTWNGRGFLIVVLCQLFVLQPLSAQAQRGMRVVVVEGNGARNIIQQISAAPLVVRVEGADQRPIEGAAVTFTAPRTGPSGQFANGTTTITVATDAEGLALAEAYHPNGLTGSYQIQVRAEFQEQVVSASIRQSNVEARRGHGKLITILSLAGAAAGAALIARSRGDNNTIDTNPISLGDSAVGAPRR
jgi:hypothetical protein